MAEMLAILGAAVSILKGGLALRDAVRDLTTAVRQLNVRGEDHEQRLRRLEFSDRRRHGHG